MPSPTNSHISVQSSHTGAKSADGPFKLPPLPFSESALAPAISARTMGFHYGKHHRGYIEKLNKLVKGEPFADMSLEQVIHATAGDDAQAPIFNNAAQAWNHTFFWNSLAPSAVQPGKSLSAALKRDFGGLDKLNEKLSKTATEHFGSGWAWLIAEGGKLSVVDTSDADTPLAHGAVCLLTIDVWEHAYYLDYQNARKSYVKAVVEDHLNWKFASANYDGIKNK
jgi:Fe-Mn family superoxide dismutase